MTRTLGRLLAALLAVPLLLALLVAASIVVDDLLDAGRVDRLTNATLPAVHPDGVAVQAFVAMPTRTDPAPAVIMIHEFWGLKPEILGKAEALAAEGYVVVAPDTFRGDTTAWFPRALYQTITTPVERVNQDLDAVFAWLIRQPAVDPDRIVVMGFCYGGGKALQYSLHNPELAGTGIFYGTTVQDPGILARLPGPVLGVFGSADAQIPLEEAQSFEAALAQAGIPHEFHYYEGMGHAFVTDMDAIRAGGAPGAAWAAFLAFLDSTVGP